MIVLSIIPLLIAVIGAVGYGLTETKPRSSALLLWVFVVGFFWFVSTLVQVSVLRIGH